MKMRNPDFFSFFSFFLFVLNNKRKRQKLMSWWEFSTVMNESIKLTLAHHLTWWGWFFSFHAVLSGLVPFFSAVCPFGTLWRKCLPDAFCTLVAAEKMHYTSCLARAALNYLGILPLAGKTASQQCPNSPGKDIHQHRPVFPLGACPFWCLSLSLIGSYSSKSCQGSLAFFLSCTLSGSQGGADTQREHGKNVQMRPPIWYTRPQNAKAWVGVLTKTHSWVIRCSLSTLLCH